MNILCYGIFLPINSCMDISNIVRSTPKLVLYLVIFQLNLNDLSIEVIEMVALLQARATLKDTLILSY